jgi:hypothetical protein
VLDVFTQVPASAQREAQRAAPSLVFSADATAVVEFSLAVLEKMAGTTGLEPATSAVTGQRSNQLNYVPRVGTNNLQQNRKTANWACLSFV